MASYTLSPHVSIFVLRLDTHYADIKNALMSSDKNVQCREEDKLIRIIK